MNRDNVISNLENNQIRSLFSQAYTANIAIFAVGLLIIVAFIYAEETAYLIPFITFLFLALACRLLITYYATKSTDNNLNKFANYYVIASFFVGLDFTLFNIIYYDLWDYELRNFLTVLSLGIITAAVGSLSVWLKSYLAFSLPQILSLVAVFVLNESYFVAFTVIIFSVFMLKIAMNFNSKFKEGSLLIYENIKLISKMEDEIGFRTKAQFDLEKHHLELESIVKERTAELEDINESLNTEIGIRNGIEKQLETLAYYDDLTKLPNRTLFIENIKTSLQQSKRNESLLGVLIVDIDRFKNINDSHGHQVGDKLLISIANRLKEILRDSDVIARNGGDEFSILIENMSDAKEPYAVANKIIDMINEKFDIDGHNIHIGASVGAAMYPLDSDDVYDLIKMADTAMYEAKKLGLNNFQFYSSAMSDEITDRLILENSLHTAQDNNEFFLVYQPQVNALTQETIGFEALIRWNSPVFGVISPFKFIPILEETGLIYSVGEWVILEVIKFIKAGKSYNKKVSINLSALQCGVTNYSSKIKKIIIDSEIDPKLLEFEITETVLIREFSQTEMFLTDIHNLCCTIALDDFGTGYTSFSYLTKLPIDIIKIDRSLITDIHNNKNLQDIVRAIVTMSESLNISNVFEGVETTNELHAVKELNGLIIQGYFYSKPLEEYQVLEWFNNDVKSS